MHNRKLIVGAVVVASLGLFSGPASAAQSADTIVTFDITAGTLDITAPAAVDLGDYLPGAAVTGLVGPVTVTDNRASATPTWTASVISTDFINPAGGSNVLATDVDYWSGPATTTTGSGTFTPGQVDAAAAAPLNNATLLTAFSHTTGTGNNSATWNPTLVLQVPADAVAGTYTGTLTHSVA